MSIENALRFNLISFKFQFQNYYSNMHLLLCNCKRSGASCAWLSEPATQTFPLTNAAESHTYNLKAVYSI